MKILLAPALVATLLVAGCSSAPAEPSALAAQPAAVRTELPGLSAPAGEPDLPSLADTRPQPGQAVRATGPFDNRFEIDGLSFDGHTVSGAIRVTTDVSDLIELQVIAGFYDAGGRLLGTARFEHHADGDAGHGHAGPPSEIQEFSIDVPSAATGAAVSAAVGVPVLVNE